MKTMNRRSAGFTFLELVIVIAIVGMLAGTLATMASSQLAADRTNAVKSELEAIAVALQGHYADNAAFPVALDAVGFYGVRVQPGVGNSLLEDDWAPLDTYYRYSRTVNPDVATVWSVGPDGVDSGSALETLRVVVHGSVTGLQKTRERIDVIAASLARHLAAGRTITGVWSTDRTALGLGVEYATDGFGTAFQLLSTDRVVRSAGPDRNLATTADNLTN
jgi:prepilin-type N-terminal cleavage/methylation domain-containing protein